MSPAVAECAPTASSFDRFSPPRAALDPSWSFVAACFQRMPDAKHKGMYSVNVPALQPSIQ